MPATTDNVAFLAVDGVVQAESTLPTGETDGGEEKVGVFVERDRVVTVGISTAGTDGENWSLVGFY